MELNLNEVHLWTFPHSKDQDLILASKYYDLCSLKEKKRSKEFYFEKDQSQFILSRAFLRTVLSHYLPTKPNEWQFIRNSFGKPSIQFPIYKNVLQFNLSHTKEWIVCAVTWNYDIGVDVECYLRQVKNKELACRFFAQQEVDQLSQLSVEKQKFHFFDYWTLKEAYIKACGKGLYIPLNSFSFELDQNEIKIHFDFETQDHLNNWNFWLLQPNLPYKIAIALHHKKERINPQLKIYEMNSLEKYQIQNDYCIRYSSNEA